MAICASNAQSLASEACIEDLMMQARKIKYGVIGLTETRRRRPLHAVFENEKELFLGSCDSKGVGGVIVGDFNVKIGLSRTAEELHIGTHGMEWNEKGGRLSEFIMSTHIINAN
ncbi:hypothetical protein V3C99_017957 [Haemonchus contortus]|uniref:Endo/exonuclease/phosphatase domain-containing protein n=1 Tax=Haemonchus contortus TaxID=6289 RepID=A0A7I5EE88_HAECO